MWFMSARVGMSTRAPQNALPNSIAWPIESYARFMNSESSSILQQRRLSVYFFFVSLFFFGYSLFCRLLLLTRLHKRFSTFFNFFFNRLFVRFLSRLNHAFAHNSIRLSTRSSNIKYINVYALCFDPYWSEWTHTLNTVESCWKLEGFFFLHFVCVSSIYIYSFSAYEWGNSKSHWIECRVVESLRIAMS